MLPRRVDTDLVLSQVLIWLVLTGYVVIVYVGVIALGTLPFGIRPVNYAPPWWLNLIAFVAIAGTFFPVYRWIRGSVWELIYSQQNQSHPAVSQLSQYLESSPSPSDILPTIVETFAHALKLPYVEIQVQPPHIKYADEQTAAAKAQTVAYGKLVKGAPLEHIPLSYHGVSIGALRVSGRRGNEPLSSSDRNLLYHLAQQVGMAAILVFGVILALIGHLPILGFIQRAQQNWLLVSIILLIGTQVTIPTLFIPRGKKFKPVLQEALAKRVITPELQNAMNDSIVNLAYRYEEVALIIITALMVFKPF